MKRVTWLFIACLGPMATCSWVRHHNHDARLRSGAGIPTSTEPVWVHHYSHRDDVMTVSFSHPLKSVI